MSQENVDLIRRAVELGNAGDMDALDELFDPDVEIRDLEPPPDIPEVLRGREAARAATERWLEVLDSWAIEVEKYIDEDPWVICPTNWRATGKGSSTPTEMHTVEAFEVRNGMIVRQIASLPDVAAALRAVRSLE